MSFCSLPLVWHWLSDDREGCSVKAAGAWDRHLLNVFLPTQCWQCSALVWARTAYYLVEQCMLEASTTWCHPRQTPLSPSPTWRILPSLILQHWAQPACNTLPLLIVPNVAPPGNKTRKIGSFPTQPPTTHTLSCCSGKLHFTNLFPVTRDFEPHKNLNYMTFWTIHTWTWTIQEFKQTHEVWTTATCCHLYHTCTLLNSGPSLLATERLL